MADGIINLIAPRLPIEIPINEKDLKHHWIKIYDQANEFDFKQPAKDVSKLDIKGNAVNLKIEKMIDTNFLKKQSALKIQSAYRGHVAKLKYKNIKRHKACEYMSKMILYD
jgi:hypothetical protein